MSYRRNQFELIEKLARLGEVKVRQGLDSGEFGDIGSPEHSIVSVWLSGKEAERLAVATREANALVRESNALVREANAVAREANDVAREANRRASRANIVAIIAAVIAVMAIIVPIVINH